MFDVPRFMGSFLPLARMHRDLEPGRDALPRVQAEQQLGPTRFMERGFVNLPLHPCLIRGLLPDGVRPIVRSCFCRRAAWLPG